MKITVEFDNLQEIDDFCNGILIAPGLAQTARQEREDATEQPKKTEVKKSSPKKEKAQEEAKAEPDEAPAEGPEPVEEKEEKAATEHSDSDLKMLLSDKLKAGKKKEVKALFDKHGVSCLTDLLEKESDNIDAIYAEAEVI